MKTQIEQVREGRKSSEACSMCNDFCTMKKGMAVFKDDIAPEKQVESGE
jgi:hypothetical protein